MRAQTEVQVDSLFNQLAVNKSGLNEKVRIDISGLSLYDFITTLAEEHKLNVSADTSLNYPVNTNFFDAVVKDVFLFLVKKYNLEVQVVNNIIVFNKKIVVQPKPEPKQIKKIDVTFNKNNGFLSINLKNDSLPRVAEEITNISGHNLVLSPLVKTKKVSAYILNRPFDQVLEMMAKSNSLSVTQTEDGFYYLDQAQEEVQPVQDNLDKRNDNDKRRRNPSTIRNSRGYYDVTVNDKGFLDVKAIEANAGDMIIEAAEKLNLSYFIYDMPTNVEANLVAYGISFTDLLSHIFRGKSFTYKVENGTYLIGAHDTQGLRKTELVQLRNRTIETVLKSLPKSLVQSLDVKEFIELNGFVVSGSGVNIQEFKDYILEIDKVVPVVQIEVIIVQYQKSYDIQTGLQAGLSNENKTTSGVLFPTTDVNLNAKSVNSLIDAFNGLGWINLGKVTQNFYAQLQALENNSIIKIASTPKLVTLNGHEANSSIGQTSYYFEQDNQLINSGVTNNILQSGTWKSTEANLSVKIKPLVSSSENVTLTIQVERSSFLARVGENAPPGKATQKFESSISVRNNEMILLGGLDELENENSGSGTPLLSRIPIIKWFFSSRTKRKDKSKLHIFIKPTVTY